MVQLTFITAVAPYHSHLISAVQAQGTAQTVPCRHVIIHDTTGKGAGWARNRGLDQVETEFVAFLDADDQIAPVWAAETLAAFDQADGARYIYTDHVQDGKRIDAPNCAWTQRTWHVITALIPTAWAREVGGFDETMPAFEDTDFFLKLITSGHCGRRLARPLFHYGSNGKRSSTWVETPAYEAAMRYFSKNYGGRTMGCCGDVTPNIPPSGDRQEGDVLAQAIYAGNRRELGRATGRLYPRTGNGAKLWMDARDVAASPTLWRAVMEQEANNTVPDFDYTSFADYAAKTEDYGVVFTNVDEIGAFFMAETTPPADYEPPPEAIRVEDAPVGERPSADAITAKAKRARSSGRRQSARGMEAKASA